MHSWSPTLLCIGAVAGLMNVGLMLLVSEALRSGPSGLTFAFQNASSIFPNVILVLLFGASFGFVTTLLQIVGMCFVLLGLFMASSTDEAKISKKWIIYVLGSFVLQIAILTLFQWRCLLFTCADQTHALIPFSVLETEDAWFMPGFFGAALLSQLVVQKETVQTGNVIYGSLGGVANALSTYFLLTATKWALPLEKGIIFPLFAVSVIVICNIWGYKIYRERVNIPALIFCVVGILVAGV